MPGQTSEEDAPETLHIIERIRVADDSGAQLVVCRLGDDPVELVAKIYDPLYYGFIDPMWKDIPRDVSAKADKNYCYEVAAYLELDGHFGGKEIPKFHGSWTFQLPLELSDGSIVMRDVRMILMEWIDGETMQGARPERFAESVRLDAIAHIFEMYNRIVFAGVKHDDLYQCNIMVCEGTAPRTIERIVLIDFSFSTVTRLDNFEEKYGQRPVLPKPRNPAVMLWDVGWLYGRFGNWAPASWDQRARPAQQWLLERWGTSEEFMAPDKPLVLANEEEY